MVDRCVCTPGYFIHILKPQGDKAMWEYTCCWGEPTEECGDWQYMGPVALGIMLLGIMLLGILGFLIGTLLIHCNTQKIPVATKEDLHLLDFTTVLDGAQLCRAVEQKNWCVTLQDLQQFKRLVRDAVTKGQIQPTRLDPFEASDRIGPEHPYGGSAVHQTRHESCW